LEPLTDLGVHQTETRSREIQWLTLRTEWSATWLDDGVCCAFTEPLPTCQCYRVVHTVTGIVQPWIVHQWLLAGSSRPISVSNRYAQSIRHGGYPAESGWMVCYCIVAWQWSVRSRRRRILQTVSEHKEPNATMDCAEDQDNDDWLCLQLQ